MEKIIDNKAVAEHGVVRIGVEEDCGKPIRCRSGLLVSKPEHRKPKITVLSNEKIKNNDELMPTVGVYCTMACHDYEPPRLLSASESEAVLRTKCVIPPGTMPIPKEGTVGYVKVESKNYEGPELKPRWIDVDEYEFETIG